MRRRMLWAARAAMLALALVPVTAWAQSATTGAIAGTVKDTSGAVMPGVTVEAASPALIEKIRTVVTDAQGNYKIVELRPGTYTVTFSLPGFSTVKREGIDLTSGFTASVNADLKVGSLEETVTVTGASPVVDIQNVRSQTTFKQEVLDALPTPKTLTGFTALTLGAVQGGSVVQDVGGTGADTNPSFTIHGGRADSRQTQDGMNANGLDGNAGGSHVQPNTAAFQEVTVESSGMMAEAETSGLQFNRVPKDGGNRFSLYGGGSYAPGELQATNLDDELRSRGLLQQGSAVKKLWDYNFGVGGPIKKDTLWFYGAMRWWGAQNYGTTNYFSATPNSFTYTPDLGRLAFFNSYFIDRGTARITWQITPKMKLAGFNTNQHHCYCYFSVDTGVLAPEASPDLQWVPTDLAQAAWTYTASNKLLLESGITHYNAVQTNLRPEGVLRSSIPIIEQSTGLSYNARAVAPFGRTQYGGQHEISFNQRVALSYVTGSHAFKTGMTLQEAKQRTYAEYGDLPVSYGFLRGVPSTVTEWADPAAVQVGMWPSLGLFVQDQWSVKKFTLNLGTRFDYFRSDSPAQDLAAGLYVPARNMPREDNIPNWKDIVPRVGAAYDLFGNGKTAIKGFLGKYVILESLDLARNASLPSTLVPSATRTWNDANGNFVPDCTLTNPTANGECGAINNSRFGQFNRSRVYDTAIMQGWGARGYNWQGAISLQQELRPGMALNVGYFRTWYGNFGGTRFGTVTCNATNVSSASLCNNLTIDNLSVTPADFDPYCVTTPVDPRLPGGGGNQLCGLYDVTTAKFGQINEVVKSTSEFGERTEVFNGVDVSVNARFGKGGLVQGGVSVGRTQVNNCVVVDSPQGARPGFCSMTIPWWDGLGQIKLNGVYPVPFWGLQASANYQNLPGFPVSATNVYRNAEIAPSLGRNLSAGANGTATVDLIPLYTIFGKRLSQVDVRFTKKVNVGRARLSANVDIFNLLNANTILRERTAYGPTWRQPTNILTPRFFKFGGVFEW